MSEAKRSAPAVIDPRARRGSSWGAPRCATHLAVLVAALLVAAIAPFELSQHINGQAAPPSVSDKIVFFTAADQASVLKPPAIRPELSQLPPMKSYTVRFGDTIPSIATRAGISIETLVSVNHLSEGDELSLGELLLVPPVNGRMVPVRQGQTLQQVVNAYHADLISVEAVNRLTDASPLPDEIFLPAVTPDTLTSASPVPPSEIRRHLVRFVWPTQGTITQMFWAYHPGIDIANVTGTPEYAADGGRVVFAGWGTYGIYAQIDHGNGFSTVYGHMSKVFVTAGQLVSSGQRIGLMGATGRATGPHLHFEIRYHGVAQNPLDYLP